MDIFTFGGTILIMLCLMCVLRQFRPELGAVCGAVFGAVLLAALLVRLSELLPDITGLGGEYGEIGKYIEPLVKSLGISVVAAGVGEICRDAGENALASKAELCGKIAILALSIGVLKELTSLVSTLLS